MPLLPDQIENESQLDEVLTAPSPQLIESIGQLEDPLILLGAGGKMGPTLARLAQRAAEQNGRRLRIIAASRFRNPSSREWLEKQGIETQAVDIFCRDQLSALPDSPNVVYLVGMKFGTSSDPVPTWATNTVAPVLACQRFAGARMVALSTGNVYPLSSVESRGSNESDPLTPLGEYANAAVARERIFQYFAAEHATPTVTIRLNYAHDLRYGVLTDIAQKIWLDQPVDVTMGHFNAIWQGDANEMVLRAFALCNSPAQPLNVTSPEIYSTREVAERLGALMGKSPRIVGQEADTALLSDATLMERKLGKPRVDLERLLHWIAGWTSHNGKILGKPTHYETRDGNY